MSKSGATHVARVWLGMQLAFVKPQMGGFCANDSQQGPASTPRAGGRPGAWGHLLKSAHLFRPKSAPCALRLALPVGERIALLRRAARAR